MKITVDYDDKETDYELLKIESAKLTSAYNILIKFNDGRENLVDFEPFLLKTNHPAIKKYLDKNRFSNFKLSDGNINWNDYDLIFPISDLYEGNV